MVSMQQRLLPFLHKGNGKPVHVGFTDTQVALLSDTDVGHVAALLEKVQAFLNTHGNPKEVKTNAASAVVSLQVGARLDRGILHKDRPNEDSLFIAQSVLHTLYAPA